MLVMSKGALSAGQAQTYYEEKWSHDDYYSEKKQVLGQWFGRGAYELGLEGPVTSEAFRSVLRGIHPLSGESLVRKANGYVDRRAGWDATFNAPKSVSIQALVGGDERLIKAHHNAVSRALEELEQYALSRRRGGTEWVVSANIVAARFDHIAARPANGADDGYGPDPHLHTHVVIANMTRRPDRQWRGLDPIEIYRAQSFATAVYRSELARDVQQLGYRTNITGRDGRWELDGYTREQVTAFSRRRQDIEKALAREGLAGAKAAQNIAHRTRPDLELGFNRITKRERLPVFSLATKEWLASKGALTPLGKVYYEQYSRKLAREFGDRLVSDITLSDIAALQRKRLGEGLSPRTVNCEIATLRQILKHWGCWMPLATRVRFLRERADTGRARRARSASRAIVFELVLVDSRINCPWNRNLYQYVSPRLYTLIARLLQERSVASLGQIASNLGVQHHYPPSEMRGLKPAAFHLETNERNRDAKAVG